MQLCRIRQLVVIGAALVITACGGTGGVQPLQPVGTLPPATSPSGDRPPTVSLPATAEVLVGNSLSLKPTASDPEGQPLTFSITNKPAWLSFDALTGEMSGTPTAADVGTYERVRVTVSDGTSQASAQVDITVAAIAVGRATLSWVAPTERTDGTPLVDLAGFRIYYGTNQNDLRQTTQIPDAGANSWVIENLTAGTWYFAATAYDASGAESSRSNVASKTIG